MTPLPLNALPPDAPCRTCVWHRAYPCPCQPRKCLAQPPRPELDAGGVGCGEWKPPTERQVDRITAAAQEGAARIAASQDQWKPPTERQHA